MTKHFCETLVKDGLVPYARLGTQVIEPNVRMSSAYRKLLKSYLGLSVEERRHSPVVTAVLEITHDDPHDRGRRLTAYKKAGTLMQNDHFECDHRGRITVPAGAS